MYKVFQSMKFFQDRYQQLIHRDTDDDASKSIRKFFPWFLVLFFALQVWYYFEYFHIRINKVMHILEKYHDINDQVYIRPRIVAINYDQFILFLFFVFITITFTIFTLVAFDISQRNKVIRQLKKQLREQAETKK